MLANDARAVIIICSLLTTRSCRAETTLKQRQRRPLPGLPIPNGASGAAVAFTDHSDEAPFLGTPYASSQPFDYPFPINTSPPDPLLGPQKPLSALPIASSLMSAPSLVQPSSDPLASLPSIMSSLVSNPNLSRRAGSISADRSLRHSRSNSSLFSARSLVSQGSGSSSSSTSTYTPLSVSPSKPPSLSSRSSSPNRCNRRMTLTMAPSFEARSVRVTPRRPKSLTLITNQVSNESANPVSSASSRSCGIGSLSSLSITSVVDDKRIPPTLRSKLQRTRALVVAPHDVLPKSTEASARATPLLEVHDPPLRLAPLPLPKRPLPVRAHSHASSFLGVAPGPIQERAESAVATPPSPTESTRISRQSSMKRVIKKTASLVELGLEGLKRAAVTGRSSAGSKRSRTRAGPRTQDLTTEANGDGSEWW
jgi:hypothetical protein